MTYSVVTYSYLAEVAVSAVTNKTWVYHRLWNIYNDAGDNSGFNRVVNELEWQLVAGEEGKAGVWNILPNLYPVAVLIWILSNELETRIQFS